LIRATGSTRWRDPDAFSPLGRRDPFWHEPVHIKEEQANGAAEACEKVMKVGNRINAVLSFLHYRVATLDRGEAERAAISPRDRPANEFAGHWQTALRGAGGRFVPMNSATAGPAP
jgi:hypothetical protein